MFGDLLQACTQGTVVEAHGRKWVVVYAMQSLKRGASLYLAVETDAPLPAPVQLIMVDDPKPETPP